MISVKKKKCLKSGFYGGTPPHGSSCFSARVLLCLSFFELTLRFDLRGSSLISTHLFKVLNLLKKDDEKNMVVRLAAL